MVEPLQKITKSKYVCSNKFDLEDLYKLFDDVELYGVMLVSGKESRYYKCSNNGSYNLVWKVKTKLQKKMKKGGQSAQRIGRICDEKRDRYLGTMINMAIKCFYNNHKNEVNVNGIVVSGPAEWKEKIIKDKRIKKHFGYKIKVITEKEITENTIKDLMRRKIFAEYDVKKENETKEYVKKMMALEYDRLVFGYDEVKSNLDECMLEKIITMILKIVIVK